MIRIEDIQEDVISCTRICIHTQSRCMYRAFSGGLPVVKPAQVLDSIAANRLLCCSILLELVGTNIVSGFPACLMGLDMQDHTAAVNELFVIHIDMFIWCMLAGVKAGILVKEAKTRCPDLVIVTYDFGAYEMVADQFYDILHKHCNKVQVWPLKCG
ncbi:hypothetical protein ACS0TY_000510 [Phlomoides rotata]